MSKTKSVAKKPKAGTSKKVSVRNDKSSAKPIKLGGLPGQGELT